MIILMLFIQNFILKTQLMLQNGLIILTFVWSLMRMVNIPHDYDKCDDFDFPLVNCSYLSSDIFQNPMHMVFCFTVDTYCSDLFEI